MQIEPENKIIYTPNALPMFRDDNKNKRRRFDKIR